MKEFIKKGIINLVYVRTEKNTADSMTKPMQKLKHSYCTNMLMHHQGASRRLPDRHIHVAIVLAKGAL